MKFQNTKMYVAAIATFVSIAGIVPDCLAYDCEADEAVAQLRQVILCEQVLQCPSFGIDNAEFLKSASPDEITQRFMRSPTHANLYSTNLIATAGEKKAIDNVGDSIVSMLISAKGMIKSIQPSPLDYNKAIDRYECEATISWNVEAVKAFRELAFLQILLGQPEGQGLYAIDARDGTKKFETYYRIALAQRPVRYTPTNVVHFSVQQLRRGGTLIKVSDFRLPFD